MKQWKKPELINLSVNKTNENEDQHKNNLDVTNIELRHAVRLLSNKGELLIMKSNPLSIALFYFEEMKIIKIYQVNNTKIS